MPTYALGDALFVEGRDGVGYTLRLTNHTPERYEDVRIIFQDFETSNWSWDAVAGAFLDDFFKKKRRQQGAASRQHKSPPEMPVMFQGTEHGNQAPV